jgi:hypothetical protein
MTIANLLDLPNMLSEHARFLSQPITPAYRGDQAFSEPGALFTVEALQACDMSH